MALDIGIDLGTANIIITIAGKGIVLNEPSVVAYDKKKKAVVAVGAEAYKMIGRTPEYIVAVRPLKDGVISDNDMTEAMIREFIHMVNGGAMMKPRIVLCVPSSVTDVEQSRRRCPQARARCSSLRSLSRLLSVLAWTSPNPTEPW